MKRRKNNYGIYKQFNGILHKTQSEPLRAENAQHRPHHAPLRGGAMLGGDAGKHLSAGFQAGKLQLRHRRGRPCRNVCGGEKPSWCSSSNANDQRAVTIECASDTKSAYAFKDAVYQTLIKLCVDICKRNGKKKLLWLGDKTKTLNYSPKADEMVLTVHRWFANKSCPGDWLYARLGDLASKVTAALGSGTGGPMVPQLHREHRLLPFPGFPRRML